MTEGYWMWGWGLERVRKTEVRATPRIQLGSEWTAGTQ